MSRKARKGILGVPRRAERQVFVFGRFAEELPSDDSEDSDFNPSKDEENASIACSLPGAKKKSKTRNNSKKRSVGSKKRTGPVCTNKKAVSGALQIQENDSKQGKFSNKTGEESCRNKLVNEASQGEKMNAAITLSKQGSRWSDLIPVELLLIIFQNVIKSICGSSVPFLCRMSMVCRRWREVASEPILWKKVDLSMPNFKILIASTATIKKLVPTRLTGVIQLNLLGWHQLTDKAIQTIGRHCHELQSIVLSRCENLTSKSIASLADKCHKLKMIDISFTKIDISDLQHIATKLGSQLEKLNLMNCTRLSGGHILPLIQENCPNLTFLDVSGTNIRRLQIEKLQAGCPKLKELFLVNLVLISTPTCKTLSGEKKPNGFPQLENLGLSCSYIGELRSNNFLYRILWSSPNLRVLDIRGPNSYSSEGLQRLPVNSLEQLYLTIGFYGTFSKMAAIVEKWHHSLEVLDLSLNKEIEDEHVELLRNFGMPKLHTLDLSSTSITADGVRSVLNGCPNLTDLNLTSCRGVPRGIKRRHQGESLRNLPQRMVDIEKESSESE